MEILYQVLDALVYIHSSSVCHWDIKAANVLYNPPYTYKVTDFGCAKYVPNHQLEVGDSEPTSMTSTGKTGTVTHMAPEIITAKWVKWRKAHYTPYDPFKADVYSFGVMLYEMASQGDYPYEGETPAAYYENVLDLKVKPKPIEGDFPDWFIEMYEQCM